MGLTNNIIILTYWSYKDPLVQTYTLPYVRIIGENLGSKSKVYLFTLEQDFHKMKKEDWETEKTKLLKENIHLIRFKYSNLGLKMMFKLIALIIYLYKTILVKKISTIHVWGTAAGSMGYLLSIATGKKLIIDSYEPHAESMVENGTWAASSYKYRLMFWLEKKQSKRAHAVIALTEGMRDYALKKYNAHFDNYYIKPALVDLDKFKYDHNHYLNLRKKEGVSNNVIGVYAGKIGGIYLTEEIFDFIKTASDYWKGNFKMYLLTDASDDVVNSFIAEKNIPSDCIEKRFVNHHEIPNYLQLADFAFNPVKPVPSKRYCTSIKDGEYWAMSLPIIITKDISDDSGIIEKEGIGYVLQELTEREYINACKTIATLLQKEETAIKVRNIAIKYRNFDIANKVYKKIYG